MINPNAVITAMLLMLAATLATAQVPKAFYGAEGFGSLATGGRGGDVYIVTNRNNSGAGSLREGLNTDGTTPRTIVFAVGGTINLDSRIRFNFKNNITVAGQTAPGGGILLKGGLFQITNGSNFIVRHIRVRYGNGTGADDDAISVSNAENIIFDHVSASWGRDECLSLTNDVHNITVQNCIIAEGLRTDHQYGSLINSERAGGGRITLWRNLYINQLGRTPRASSQNGEDFLLDMVNNVVYNWGRAGDWGTWATTTSNERTTINMVNNFHIAGPSTYDFFAELLNQHTKTILSCGDGNDRAYLSGNRIDSDRDGILENVAATWSNVRGSVTQLASPAEIPEWARISQVQSAEDAFTTIMADAGAMPWNRDAVDDRLVNLDLASHGTIGAVKTSQPDWPSISNGTTVVDTDKDGMPDTWEQWYGTSPTSASNNLVGQDGYTALELYLQWLIDPSSVQPLPSPTPTATPALTDTPWPTETPTYTPSPTPTPTGSGRAVGDFDDSGCTDIDDFLFLLDYWQAVSPIGGDPITVDDFLALLDNWQTGPSCP